MDLRHILSGLERRRDPLAPLPLRREGAKPSISGFLPAPKPRVCHPHRNAKPTRLPIHVCSRPNAHQHESRPRHFPHCRSAQKDEVTSSSRAPWTKKILRYLLVRQAGAQRGATRGRRAWRGCRRARRGRRPERRSVSFVMHVWPRRAICRHVREGAMRYWGFGGGCGSRRWRGLLSQDMLLPIPRQALPARGCQAWAGGGERANSLNPHIPVVGAVLRAPGWLGGHRVGVVSCLKDSGSVERAAT